ncbi:MAG: DNA-3-methyladenine glycosylase I, partial [Pseudomonadota bacterium]
MRTFDEIHAIAAARKGGTEALEAMLEKPKPPAEIAAIPEATWLATFSRGILSAGLNWKVVENKWPTIEPAFRGFDVDALAMMDDDWLDALLADPGVIRSGAKITAIRDNAIFLQGLRAQGGAGQVFADWPSTDFKGLLELLKTQGARLGGATGAYGLRYLGRDSYIL